jgi:hypothetical protein
MNWFAVLTVECQEPGEEGYRTNSIATSVAAPSRGVAYERLRAQAQEEFGGRQVTVFWSCEPNTERRS